MFEAVVVQSAGWEPEANTEPPVIVGGLEALVNDDEAVGWEEARDAAVDEVAAGMSDKIVTELSEYFEEDSVQCSVLDLWRAITQV